MKLFFVENMRFPSERAHAYQIAKTCEGLRELGVEVELVVANRSNAKITQDAATYFQLQHALPVRRLPVIDWLKKDSSPMFYRFFYLIERWTFLRSLRKFTRMHQADIWYTRDPSVAEVLTGSGCRVVLELHDASGRKRELLSRLRSIWRYVVITKGLQEVLREIGIPAQQILVAPDGFEPRDFLEMGDRSLIRQQWGVPNDAHVVLYAGGFYPWKGVDFVLEHWALTDEQTHLVLIGGPPDDLNRLRRLIQEKNIPRVHLFSALPHAEVVKQFAGADVGLLPTSPHSEVGRSYTSPLKLFEYLAAGLPVLASDVPSSREILSDQVACFFHSSPERFVAAVRESKDASWLTHAAATARQVVQPYTWQHRTEQIVNWLTFNLPIGYNSTK